MRKKYEEILSREIDRLRAAPYSQFKKWADSKHSEVSELTKNGTQYQIEKQAIYDDKGKGHIRVMVSVDDGGLSAFIPKTDDFIIAPDGSFVGE